MRSSARIPIPWLAALAAVFMTGWPGMGCAEGKADPQTEEVSQAVKNTRQSNNFRLTAAIKGPQSDVPVDAEINGRNFQLTTMEGVLRNVNGECWITRDLGKTWAATESETWILFIILTPLQPDKSKNSQFEFVGTEDENGHVLRHFRLKIPVGDRTDPDELPQFWLIKGEKDEWFVHRAKCPVMVKDGAFPTVDVRVSDIGKVPEIKVPKGVSAPILPLNPPKKE